MVDKLAVMPGNNTRGDQLGKREREGERRGRVSLYIVTVQ